MTLLITLRRSFLSNCSRFEARMSYASHSNYSPILYDATNDPAPIFLQPQVQKLLRTLTRVDLNRVYRRRKLGAARLSVPTIKFLTDEELQDELQRATRMANKFLQIPPVMAVRQPRNRTLSEDWELQGLEESRLVFVDISYGVKERERMMVVREPDGRLVDAEWELRDRMSQVYFPVKHRYIEAPQMFSKPEALLNVLERGDYEFVLDRACRQFEPDDEKYQATTSITYQFINDRSHFEPLRSTRHFGALAFFLAWNRTIDHLLLELIESGRTATEGQDLVQLYGICHRIDSLSIDDYISKYAVKRASLELALDAYRELERRQIEREEGIRLAHGSS